MILSTRVTESETERDSRDVKAFELYQRLYEQVRPGAEQAYAERVRTLEVTAGE
jgi:hypothetical protein